MRVVIAADHAGFELKQKLLPIIRQEFDPDVQDMGTYNEDSCDYPRFAVRVAHTVVAGRASFGILICGTGIGMSVAANKVRGAVAALCGDCYSARMAREHNDAGILCLGGRVLGPGVAEDIVREFLTAEPITGVDRYVHRRQQVCEIERGTPTND